MGALARRYAFVLNPYVDAGFTKCPRCEAKTRVRKLPLVIHGEGFGLVVLRKTCRLCLDCETLVAHKDELDTLIRGVLGSAADPKYVVLGTASREAWRRGAEGSLSFDEAAQHMADFKTYLRVNFTPRGWYPKDERTRTEI
jgi:hypothetical protein